MRKKRASRNSWDNKIKWVVGLIILVLILLALLSIFNNLTGNVIGSGITGNVISSGVAGLINTISFKPTLTILSTPGTITTCQTIDTPGVYTFGSNITLSTPHADCFYITTNNVVINGNGYSMISTPGSGQAFYTTNVLNITIGNISQIRRFTYGVYFTGNNSLITNLTVFNSSYGLFMQFGNNNTISNINVTNSSGSAFYVDRCNNNTISNFYINGSSYSNPAGFTLLFSNDNNISGSIFGNISSTSTDISCDNSFDNLDNGVNYSSQIKCVWLSSFSLNPGNINSCGGINQSGTYTLQNNLSMLITDRDCFDIVSSDVVLDGNGYSIIYNATPISSLSAIYSYDVRNITIRNFSIYNNYSGYGDALIYLDRTNNSLIENNFINYSRGEGIKVKDIQYLGDKDSYNNTIRNNNITSRYSSIYLGSCYNCNVSGNNLVSYSYQTISFEVGSGNISGNNITCFDRSQSYAGIRFTGTVENSTVSYNNITTNNTYGIGFDSTGKWTNISNNFINVTGADNYVNGITISTTNVRVINNNIYINSTSSGGVALYNENNTVYGNNISVIGRNSYGVYVDDSNNNVSNNYIFANSQNNWGLYVYKGFGTIEDNSLYNNIINSSSGRIYIEGSVNTTLKNNTIINRNYSYVDLNITGGSNKTKLINQYIENYTLNGSRMVISIENTDFGKIQFISNVNGSGNNLSNDIRFGNNSVYVNSSKIGLNRSANITLYGLLTNFSSPTIYRDGSSACNYLTSPSCNNFTSLNAGNVSFNVSSWSNYSIGEIPVYYPNFFGLNSSIYVCEGGSLSYGFNVSDVGQDLSTVTINPSSVFLISPTITVVNSSLSIYTIESGTISKAQAGGANNANGGLNYSRTITAMDSFTNSNSSILNITVIEINTAPVMETMATQNVVAGSDFSRVINVNDSENGNSSSGNLSFNITFNSGNESFNISNFGLISFTSNTSMIGTYNVSVCATDKGLTNAHENISLCGETGTNKSDCETFLIVVSATVPVGDGNSGGGGGGGGGGGASVNASSNANTNSVVGNNGNNGGGNGVEIIYNVSDEFPGSSECRAWNNCEAVYNLSNLVEDTVFFTGQQKRECTNLDTERVFEQKRLCDTKAKVILRRTDDCYKSTLQIFDINNSLVSRLNLNNNKLDIQFLLASGDYCPYCYDRVKNYDEEGVDCGGKCIPCSSLVQTKFVNYKFSELILFVVILLLIIMINIVGLLMIKNYLMKREYILLKK